MRGLTLTSGSLLSAVLLLASSAQAQPAAEVQPTDAGQAVDAADCPPGAYCEQHEIEPDPAPEPELPPNGDEPLPGDEPLGYDEPGYDGPGYGTPPPEGGRYYTPGGQEIIYEPGDAPPHLAEGDELPEPPEKKRRRRRWRRWGMNMRLNAAILPQYRDDIIEQGMFGGGLSLRYRPVRHFALDASADFLIGRDSNGLERQELPLSLSAMIYVNPRSFAQFYLFGGVNWALARVTSEEPQDYLAEETRDDYTYFGGHGGLGVEMRFSPLVALNLDALTYIRSRTDDDGGGRFPEFYEPISNEISNTSVGGMARAGVSFWW